MENKEYTKEELDAMIKELQNKRTELTKQPVYAVRPLREKLAYDLQPVKLLSGAIKTFIVLVLIAGLLVGYGYWKGKQTKPVYVDMKDFQAKVTCTYDKTKEHLVGVKNYKFYFDDKYITAADIPKLKPYGIELHPKLFAGLGTKGPAVGAGFEFAYFYKLNADVFLMSDKAAYVGISYDLKIDDAKVKMNWFENSSIGLAVGKGLENIDETRIILYWSVKF